MGSCCCVTCPVNVCRRKEQTYQKGRGLETTRVFKRVEKAIVCEDDDGLTCVNEYRILYEKYTTANGRFCICEDRNLGTQYAVKVSPKGASISKNEVEVLKTLDHPNLVQLVEVIDDPHVCACAHFVTLRTICDTFDLEIIVFFT